MNIIDKITEFLGRRLKSDESQIVIIETPNGKHSVVVSDIEIDASMIDSTGRVVDPTLHLISEEDLYTHHETSN